MWKPLMDSPDIVYHFTKRENIEKIKQDRYLKKFKDIYTFVCGSYDDCIEIMKKTLLNPKAKYIDYNGLIRVYKDINKEDYVILKLKTRNTDIYKWFKSNSSGRADIDELSLAYKGNLPVNVVEEMEIKYEVSDM